MGDIPRPERYTIQEGINFSLNRDATTERGRRLEVRNNLIAARLYNAPLLPVNNTPLRVGTRSDTTTVAEGSNYLQSIINRLNSLRGVASMYKKIVFSFKCVLYLTFLTHRIIF
jgi:hypothetical protein